MTSLLLLIVLLPVLDADNERDVIGTINVSVICLDALKAVQSEMHQETSTESMV